MKHPRTCPKCRKHIMPEPWLEFIDGHWYHSTCTRQSALPIVGVAIVSLHDDKLHSVLAPVRHHDVIKLMVDLGYPTPIEGTQGFILSDGRFVGREWGRIISTCTGQSKNGTYSSPDKLFSEDLW